MGRIVTAEYRSRQFLLEHLNWWQRFTFRWWGCFRVKGNHTGRRYVIKRDRVTRGLTSYCLLVFEYDVHHPRGYIEVPIADAMLAKKILITAAERLFSLDRESAMKLPKLRAEIRRIEAQLKRMRDHALNLEMSATVPDTIPHDNPEITDNAKQRAMLLFWRHLTAEQRSEFTRQRWFTVVGNQTGSKYRISPLRAVREEGEGTYTRFYCLVIRAEITPLEDLMLAKKIIIEKDEGLFLVTAVDQGVHKAEEFSQIVLRDGR